MIRDKIIFTVTGKLQELLLREDKIDLEKTIKICRAYEQSNRHVKELRETNPTHSVNKVSQQKPKRTPQVESKKPHNKQNHQQRKPQNSQRNSHTECNFCGYKHEKKKEKCPA